MKAEIIKAHVVIPEDTVTLTMTRTQAQALRNFCGDTMWDAALSQENAKLFNGAAPKSAVGGEPKFGDFYDALYYAGLQSNTWPRG